MLTFFIFRSIWRWTCDTEKCDFKACKEQNDLVEMNVECIMYWWRCYLNNVFSSLLWTMLLGSKFWLWMFIYFAWHVEKLQVIECKLLFWLLYCLYAKDAKEWCQCMILQWVWQHPSIVTQFNKWEWQIAFLKLIYLCGKGNRE